MQRKALAASLAAVMLCGILAGCAGKADKDNKTNSTASSAVSAETSTGETAQDGDAASASSDGTAQSSGEQGTASAAATPAPTATPEPEPDIIDQIYEKYNIEKDEDPDSLADSALFSHKLEQSGVTWDDVLDLGNIPITDEVKQEYEEIQNPVLQVEKAVVDVYGYRNRKTDFTQILGTLDSLLYVMNNNPMISMNDSYSSQVSDFRSKYAQYSGMLQVENPLLTTDDVNALKQTIVDAYDFLNGNGFDVSTVDANAAQLYKAELAGETTVDNSTNAAPAPTE